MTTVSATPTKSFFVRMLTRDISLDDCILDLVDNSIDGAWSRIGAPRTELANTERLSSFHIDIDLSAQRFRIADNCGGINLNEAVNYAFTFGRKDQEETEEYSVGVYGIGMKRAVFKLGNSIRIHSTYEDETGAIQSFVVPINVTQWLASGEDNEPWDFDLEDAEAAEQTGVTIDVRELNEGTARRFGDPTYANELRRTLARDYMLPLMHGLRLSVNGDPVEGHELIYRQSTEFQVMREAYEDNGVTVEIIAGMWGTPPDDTAPEEPSRADDRSGWYVICNGRVVLAADRTTLTGWGREFPKWHSQYSGFLGVLMFSSADPSRLPMTTTKRSVDVSSSVYARAVGRIIDPTRSWINYTNERKNNYDEARDRESAATVQPITEVPSRPSVVLPKVTKAPRIEMANVNYAVPLSRMRKLARGFGHVTMPYREVGMRSFEYAYEEFVDEV